MRNRLLVFFVLPIALYSCATNNGGSSTSASMNMQPPDSSFSLPVNGGVQITGRWTLIPAMASDTATGKIPFLVFDTGRVSGNTGCNSFSGSYQSAGTNLSFANDMISTRMACPGYDEAAFVKNLLRTTGYDMKGDTLVLKADVTPLSYWLKGK